MTSIRNAHEDRALAKYRALLPYLQGNASLAGVANAIGVNVRTVRRWLRGLEAKGFAGLTRTDQGKRNVASELQRLIEGLFLQRPPIIDDYSRAIPGYYIGLEAPSVLRTALAFRQGVWCLASRFFASRIDYSKSEP